MRRGRFKLCSTAISRDEIDERHEGADSRTARPQEWDHPDQARQDPESAPDDGQPVAGPHSSSDEDEPCENEAHEPEHLASLLIHHQVPSVPTPADRSPPALARPIDSTVSALPNTADVIHAAGGGL